MDLGERIEWSLRAAITSLASAEMERNGDSVMEFLIARDGN